MIADHYVLITAGSCEFCQEAIELLRSRELNFIYTDMENAPDVMAVAKMTLGHTTVPMIWRVTVGEGLDEPAGQKFVGGCDELKKHLGINTSGE
jgi:glutaredoxin